MAVLAFVSASGSPGVSTCVVGLALSWPRDVLVVEADPTGGSGLFTAFLGGTVAPTDGLVGLAAAAQRGAPVQILTDDVVELPDSQAKVLPGIRSHLQARGLPTLWPALLAELREWSEAGRDVVVDAGRLGLHGWPEPLVTAADVTVVVIEDTLASLAGVRSWLSALAEVCPAVVCLLVGSKGPYSTGEVRAAVSDLGAVLVGRVAWDPRLAKAVARGEALVDRLGPASVVGRSLAQVRPSLLACQVATMSRGVVV